MTCRTLGRGLSRGKYDVLIEPVQLLLWLADWGIQNGNSEATVLLGKWEKFYNQEVVKFIGKCYGLTRTQDSS